MHPQANVFHISCTSAKVYGRGLKKTASDENVFMKQALVAQNKLLFENHLLLFLLI